MIRSEYFEKIFYYVYDTFSKYLDEKNSIHSSSYKIAKLAFSIELENIMIGQIVMLCGGDLEKFNKLYDP